MKQVSIRPAFVWTCPNCKIDNFEYCVPATKEMMQDVKEQEGFYDFESSPFDEPDNWMTFPDIVSCSGCKKKFKPFEPDEDNEDEF